MMRPAWRRVPYAVFWLGAVSLVMVAATGWSGAGPPARAGLEGETWRVGDAGAYDMVLTGDWRYEGRSEGEPLPGPRFEAAAIEQVPAADGEWVETMRLLWTGPAYGRDGSWSQASQTWWLEPERRIMQASTARSPGYVGVLDEGGIEQVHERSYSTADDCLLGAPWGSGPLPVACEVTGMDVRLPAGTRVEEVGLHVTDGIRLLHLRAQGEGHQVEWWMAPGAPTAWRMDAARTDQDRSVTFRLERFQRGAGDEVAPGRWPGATVQWASREPWGPPEAGITHPFPASTAYGAAMQDAAFPGLRDWLRQHPEGYVFMTSYDERHDDRGVRSTWTFHLSDGKEGYSLRVTQEDRLGLLPTAPSPQQITTHHLADDAPHRSALPGAMPTVASLWERWSLQADAGQANAWGVRILADGAGGAVVEYAAGRVASLRWGPDGVSLPPVAGRAEEHSVAAFDGAGHVTRIVERRGAPADAPGAAQPWTPASTSPVGRSWQWPDPAQGAGIGAAAVTVALAYLAWPAVKAAGVGLFSRIHGPELLHHPTRQAIMDAVRTEAGIHFGALTQRLGVPAGQARHHVRKLVDGRLLVERRSPGYTCYFPYRGTSRVILEAAPVLRAPGAQQLMGVLRDRPGTNAKDLAQAVGISPATATYHLKRLQGAGMVDAQRNGRSLSLRLTPEGVVAAGNLASA